MSRLSDATALREMLRRGRMRIVDSTFTGNEDFREFVERKRRTRREFEFTILSCESETVTPRLDPSWQKHDA